MGRRAPWRGRLAAPRPEGHPKGVGRTRLAPGHSRRNARHNVHFNFIYHTRDIGVREQEPRRTPQVRGASPKISPFWAKLGWGFLGSVRGASSGASAGCEAGGVGGAAGGAQWGAARAAAASSTARSMASLRSAPFTGFITSVHMPDASASARDCSSAFAVSPMMGVVMPSARICFVAVMPISRENQQKRRMERKAEGLEGDGALGFIGIHEGRLVGTEATVPSIFGI